MKNRIISAWIYRVVRFLFMGICVEGKLTHAIEKMTTNAGYTELTEICKIGVEFSVNLAKTFYSKYVEPRYRYFRSRNGGGNVISIFFPI